MHSNARTLLALGVILLVVTPVMAIMMRTPGAAAPRPQDDEMVPVVVEIEGLDAGEDVVLDSEVATIVEVITYTDGDDPIERKRPGRSHVMDLELSGSMPIPADLATWWEQTGDGRLEMRAVSITFLEPRGGETLQQIILRRAWPSAVSFGPDGRWYLALTFDNVRIEAVDGGESGDDRPRRN